MIQFAKPISVLSDLKNVKVSFDIRKRCDYILFLLYKLAYDRDSRVIKECVYPVINAKEHLSIKNKLVALVSDNCFADIPYKYHGKTVSLFKQGFPVEWLYSKFEKDLLFCLKESKKYNTIYMALPSLTENNLRKIVKGVPKNYLTKHICQDCLNI